MVSYPPFFLKLCTRPSIAERVREGRGRSEALNFLGAGAGAGGAGAPTCSVADGMLPTVAAIEDHEGPEVDSGDQP